MPFAQLHRWKRVEYVENVVAGVRYYLPGPAAVGAVMFGEKGYQNMSRCLLSRILFCSRGSALIGDGSESYRPRIGKSLSVKLCGRGFPGVFFYHMRKRFFGYLFVDQRLIYREKRRRNSHGPLHIAGRWPNGVAARHFQTDGESWCEGYRFAPAGQMSPPALVTCNVNI